MGRFSCTFSPEAERKLVEHVTELDEFFHGLTRKQIMKLAFEYAEINHLPHRFKNGLAGKQWFSDFCRRNNFSLRVPEKLAACRAANLNRIQVDTFFENLRSLMEKYKFPPHRIFNMDESGLSSIPSKMRKVVSPKNKRKVSKLTSGDKAETVTIVACMQPTGFTVPPAMIFPRAKHHAHLYKNAPVGTLELHASTGYMNTDLFLEWLKHFQRHVKASPEDPALLILDNHVSHRSLIAVNFCRENSIHLLSLPPHVTNEFQPLDTHFFEPLKDRYSEACSDFVLGKPSMVIIKTENIAEIFGRAYNESAKVSLAQSAFEHVGVYPFNPLKFTDKFFKASTAMDRPIPSMSTAENTGTVSDHDDGVALLEISSISTRIENSPTADIENVSVIQTETPVTEMEIAPATGIENSQVAGIEISPAPFISPSKIIPIPQAAPNTKPRNRKSKALKSEILTSSPYKKELNTLEKLKEAQDTIKDLKMKLKEAKSVAVKSSKLQKTKNKLSKRLFEETENFSPIKTRPKKKNVEIVANSSEESSADSDYQPEGTLPRQPVKKFRGLLAAKRKEINKNKKKTENRAVKTKEKPTENKNKNVKETESWYCFLCNTEDQSAMRACIVCQTYCHEECIGYTSDDDENFVCPTCV